MFFELVSILFAIVPDYVNDHMTKENKNWTSLKNFAPKLNLNHNIYLKGFFIFFIKHWILIITLLNLQMIMIIYSFIQYCLMNINFAYAKGH